MPSPGDTVSGSVIVERTTGRGLNMVRTAVTAATLVLLTSCSSKPAERSFSEEEIKDLEADSQKNAVATLKGLKATIEQLDQGVGPLVGVRTGGSYAKMPPLPEPYSADAAEFARFRAGLDAIKANLMVLGDTAPCTYVRSYNALAESLALYASARRTTAPAGLLPWRGLRGEDSIRWECK